MLEKIVSPDVLVSVSSEVPLVPNVEEEMEESVSKLESVISKTIENTKNIKELTVLGDPDDDEEEVELQQLGVPLAVEILREETTTRATEMVKPVYLEENGNQVESRAQEALEVDFLATPTPSASAPETQKPFSPYDAISSVSSSSSSSSSVSSIASAGEAGEDSSSVPTPHPPLPTDMPTEQDSTSASSSPYPSSSASSSPPSQATQPTTSSASSSSSTSTTATISTTTATSTATTTSTTTTTLSESPKVMMSLLCMCVCVCTWTSVLLPRRYVCVCVSHVLVSLVVTCKTSLPPPFRRFMWGVSLAYIHLALYINWYCVLLPFVLCKCSVSCKKAKLHKMTGHLWRCRKRF